MPAQIPPDGQFFADKNDAIQLPGQQSGAQGLSQHWVCVSQQLLFSDWPLKAIAEAIRPATKSPARRTFLDFMLKFFLKK